MALAIVGGLALSACGRTSEAPAAPAPATNLAGVAMDKDTQMRTGVVIGPLAARAAPRMMEGFARVADPSPLAALDAEARAADAAARASRSEFQRLEALAAADQAASQRSVEAARAQADADAARASLASRRIAIEWGPALATLSQSARTRLLDDIARGRAALLRIDPIATGDRPNSVRLRLDGSKAIEATILGAAGPAEQRLQTAGYFAVVRGVEAAGLAAGRLIPAELQGAATENGVFVPDAAVVRNDGAIWVYALVPGDRFERKQLARARAIDGGLLVTEGLKPGDTIVIAGAASLYAAEIGPGEEDKD